MSKIHKGILRKISEYISENKSRNFVETGTYNGSSLSWASSTFDTVSTIEVNEQFFLETKSKFNQKNITFYLGDSRHIIKTLNLNNPTIFWLDAHSGGGNFSKIDDCPLLDELSFIARSHINHYIIIDDVYAFCFPLSKPFDWQKWPSLNDIFDIIGEKYLIIIKDNFLLAVPKCEETEFKNFLSGLVEYE